ncbi:MAG: type IV pilus biogenesis protein PilP [Pseudomonadota bacterium]|nr:type IV pilus biogenesis protein PilP [Pseudomonadota bacterium]
MKNGRKNARATASAILILCAVSWSAPWAQEAGQTAPVPPPPAEDPVAAIDTTAAEKSAEEVVDMLSRNDKFTLEQMSNASDTLARLEYLRQIQEKLAAIGEIRRIRETGMAAGFPGMLPVPGSMSFPGGLRDTGGSGGYTVARIFGAGGKYGAVLTDDGGRTVIVRPGDALPGGGRVKSVSMSGVQIEDSYGTSALPFTDPMAGMMTGTGTSAPAGARPATDGTPGNGS